ncbi:hypothetical protein LSH36_252g01036 [Paralvinella palmiformis]|uniref:SCO-spondin n=1 Tax=Paralvinella palmiformis TaxID=53620 RepID=A0AAD9JKN7_9ANNE|nr:hypothetical protein LSH36_252g01036 [Paralvinella palmiformis]
MSRSGSRGYNSQNCTYRTKQAERFNTYYLSSCAYHMRRSGVASFKEGVHGLVGRVDSISLYQCDIGDGLHRYTYHLCCPSCYSNPCLNGGWCQQDSNMNYVCQCRYGYEGQNCENRINMCIISGDPHYKTIDGKQIHFQGLCKYNLVSRRSASSGLPDFSVLGKNEKRKGNDRVSYPSYFEVHYMNYTIKLKKQGIVTVNNEVVYPDHSFPPHFKITKNGLFTRFEAKDGLIVDFDGDWIGLIRVPDSYRDKIHGLCGNYDGDVNNDMTTSNNTLTTNYWEVGNSWQVDDPDVTNCTSPTDDNRPTCDESTNKLIQTNDYCGLLSNTSGLFSSCLKESPQIGESFFESCAYDVCANEGNLTAAKEAACAILSSFATYCQSKKHVILWRTKANCPMTCPAGMVFKEKGPACAATCERPDGPEKCSYPDTETCMCPDEMILLNGTCQKPELCKCPGGYEIGSSWLSDDCSLRFKCEACKDCEKRKVAKVYKDHYSCAKTEMCKKINGTAQCQSCNVNGGWGSWTQWSDCNKKTKLQTRKRSCNNPTPKCGGQLCSGSSNETQSCDPNSSGPIEPNPPSCDPDFDFQEACSECDLFANPNMFVANPCSCASYYQCSKDQVSGYYNVYELPCGPCTCWDQDILTCDRDPMNRNPNHDQCVEVTEAPEDIQYNGDKKPTICLDFNDKQQPFKNSQGFYVSWSKYNTATVLDNGVEGTALRFNGDRLEIPAYNNKEIDKMTISLWYKREGNRSENETLISNDDCKHGGSASIFIQSAVSSVGGGVSTNGFNNIRVSSNEWHHVALTYDGDVVKFYVDGDLRGSSVLNGFTARVQCPLLIGSMYDRNYFFGLMDQVCLYDDAINESQVKSDFLKYKKTI